MTSASSVSWRHVIRTTRHPATWRARSRARSCSNALRVPWAAKPSHSTTSRCSGHLASSSPSGPTRLIRGRGRPCFATRARRRRSSRLRVTVSPLRRWSSRTRRSAPRPRPPGVPGEQRFDGRRASQSAVLRLVERGVQLLGADHDRKVEERPRGRGHGDAALERDLVGGQRDLVHLQARAAPAMARRDDVDAPRPRPAHAPEGGRGAVAQDGAVAGGEHRRHPPRLVPEGAMADRVDPAMQSMQPSCPGAVLDRARAEPDRAELPRGHHAVLAHRQRRDRLLDRTRRTFGLCGDPNVRLARHAPIVATRVSRITTQTQRFSRRAPRAAASRTPAAPRRPPSSIGGCSYSSSVLRQISPARSVASRPPLRDQRSKFSVELSSGR